MTKYTITGMSCAACSARVEKAVSKVEGVSSCSVSLLTNTMGVEGDASPEQIISAVENAGYGAALSAEENYAVRESGRASEKNGGVDPREEALKDRESPKLIRRLIASAVVLLILMYCSMGHMMWNWPLPAAFDDPVFSGVVQMMLAAVVMVINQKFFISGAKALFHGGPNMDTLVALGSGTAFVYSAVQLLLMISQSAKGNAEAVMAYHMNLYFESAAMILTLITVGKLLEAKSKGRTTDALKGLFKLTPKTAAVIRDGEEREVPVADVKEGDIFVVRPGENFPVDGVVTEGSGAVNESALTGESVPVDKQPGDGVYTGTVNQSGFLRCRATRVGQDTTLNQIIKLVSDAAATKAPLARIADKVSGIFVPAVLVIALLTLAGWMIAGKQFSFAIGRAITVLVISCPCALGLATPVAIMAGSGVGAKNGILYKTAASLEILGRVKVAALDKTGTVTSGEPSVTRVYPAEGVDRSQLVELAASMEAGSEHPLGKAVVSYARSLGIVPAPARDFEALPGNGLKAYAEDGELLLGGSVSYIDSVAGISEDLKKLADEEAMAGRTPLVFAKNGRILGMICTEDTVRADSAEAVSDLRAMNISVIMLTGDNARTAAAVGKAAGVDEVIAEVRPDGKAKVIDELKKRGKTAMVGDGINDAPALVSADAGLAIGAGADVAIDAADIVLVKNRLSDAVAAVRLSRAVIRNIYENLFWAFIYNIICIPLAIGLFGLAMKPMYGALAMSLSSFCVCMNALRLNLVNIHGKKRVKAHGFSSENNVGTLKSEEEEKIVMNKEENKKTVTLNVEGMMCMHCEARVKKALEAIDGVESAAPDHEKNICTVTLSGDVSEETLKKAVEEQGYKVI
ncbi:MAG: heavy metal translocating P-type ATPase [Clostridia bacterium]|nr:heavy metal translocating P-type ATPase [Clostridia bacterium]